MSELISTHRQVPGTPAVSDALDRLGIEGTVPGIASITGGSRIAGPAFTVRYEPVNRRQPGTVGDYIDDVPEAAVVLLDNSGRTDCTVWGNILTAAASRRNIQGTVINGVCRDIAVSRQMNYPLFSRGVFMRTGKDRVEVAAVGEAVNLGAVRVEPGDFVVGDDDGVLVVPRRRWPEVLEVANQIDEVETQILQAIEEGKTLSDARETFGYHTLQRRTEGGT